MFAYRTLYILNWICRYYDEGFYDGISIIGGITHAMLYSAFFIKIFSDGLFETVLYKPKFEHDLSQSKDDICILNMDIKIKELYQESSTNASLMSIISTSSTENTSKMWPFDLNPIYPLQPVIYCENQTSFIPTASLISENHLEDIPNDKTVRLWSVQRNKFVPLFPRGHKSNEFIGDDLRRFGLYQVHLNRDITFEHSEMLCHNCTLNNS